MNERKSMWQSLSWLCSGIIIFLFFQTFITSAWATHFRYGHLTWKPRPDIAPNTAEFTFMGGFRRNGYSGTAADGFPQTGDIISEHIGGTFLCFGDGSCTGTLDFEVVSFNIAENWVIGKAILTPHTYPSPNNGGSPFIAYSDSCCRIGPGDVDVHVNNPFGDYRLETLLDFVNGNTSPTSSGVPIVMCTHDTLCSFNIPASDVDGDPVQWRLSASSEAGYGFIQPGPPYSPSTLTINPSVGIVTWDTTGAPLGLYSTQNMIEDLSFPGDVKTKVPIDYFVKVVEETSGNPPRFNIPPTPLGDSSIPLVVAAGQPLNFFVQASDADIGDVITLGHGGLPPGATFPVPTPANPVVGQFSWTPGASDVGDHTVTFTATDSQGRTAPPHSVTIRVVAQSFVNLTIKKWGWRFVSPGQPGMTYGIEYRNEGTLDAQNVTIVDPLPPEVVYVSSTGGTYNSDTRQVTFPLGTVSPGPPQYRMIVVNVKPGLPAGSIKNCATIISSYAKESTTADNQDCWSTEIQTAHDPNEKSVNPPGNITSGEILNYTIQYENTGAGTAFGVFITDRLDEDLDENTLTVNNGGTYNASTRTILWNIGALEGGKGGEVTFSARVRNNATPGTIISNFATVYFPSVPEETRTNLVVNEIPSITFTTTSLPKTKVGLGYSAALGATGGTSPYSWRVVDGKLPPGLILKSESGKIVGFPKYPGIYNFSVQATDSNGVNSSPLPLQVTVGTGEEEKTENPNNKAMGRGYGLGCGTIHGGEPPGRSGWTSMLILSSPVLWIWGYRARRRWLSCNSAASHE